MIPMHGYPKMSKSSFPTEVNFGKCPVGSSTTRTVVLKCDVPVDFQFVVDILKPNANFKLSALEGTVPAEGETMVEISFRPDSYTTQDMIIVVRVPCCCFATPTVAFAFRMWHQRLLMS